MTLHRLAPTPPLHHLAAGILCVATLATAGCSADGVGDGHPLGAVVDTTFYSLDGDEQGPGTIAVTAVREGTFDELEAGGFDLDVDRDTHTPYYVDVTYTNTGEQAVDLREASGVDSDGELIPSLTVIDLGSTEFQACPAVPDTLAPGRSIDACSIVIVPDGVDLERISYLADLSEEFVYWQARA